MSVINRAILKGHLFGTVSTRNMFVAEIARASEDTTLDIFEGYLGNIITPIRPYLASGVSFDTLEVQYQGDDYKWYQIDEGPFVWVGTGSSDQLANAVAAVLIGKVYGSFAHGRKFFSGLTESAVQGNSLVSLAMIAFAQATAAWITPYTSEHGSVVTPGIVDKNHQFHAFTSGFVASLLGSMRRRKPGLGI